MESTLNYSNPLIVPKLNLTTLTQEKSGITARKVSSYRKIASYKSGSKPTVNLVTNKRDFSAQKQRRRPLTERPRSVQPRERYRVVQGKKPNAETSRLAETKKVTVTPAKQQKAAKSKKRRQPSQARQRENQEERTIDFQQASYNKLNKLISTSISRHQLEREETLKMEWLKKQEQDCKKQTLKLKNDEIRRKNACKFKKQKLQHRQAWGVDQREAQIEQSDLEEMLKQNRKESREKYNTQGRSRIGIEFIPKVKPAKRRSPPKRVTEDRALTARDNNMKNYMKQRKKVDAQLLRLKKREEELKEQKRELALQKLESDQRKIIQKAKKRKRASPDLYAKKSLGNLQNTYMSTKDLRQTNSRFRDSLVSFTTSQFNDSLSLLGEINKLGESRVHEVIHKSRLQLISQLENLQYKVRAAREVLQYEEKIQLERSAVKIQRWFRGLAQRMRYPETVSEIEKINDILEEEGISELGSQGMLSQPHIQNESVENTKEEFSSRINYLLLDQVSSDSEYSIESSSVPKPNWKKPQNQPQKEEWELESYVSSSQKYKSQNQNIFIFDQTSSIQVYEKDIFDDSSRQKPNRPSNPAPERRLKDLLPSRNNLLSNLHLDVDDINKDYFAQFGMNSSSEVTTEQRPQDYVMSDESSELIEDVPDSLKDLYAKFQQDPARYYQVSDSEEQYDSGEETFERGLARSYSLPDLKQEEISESEELSDVIRPGSFASKDLYGEVSSHEYDREHHLSLEFKTEASDISRGSPIKVDGNEIYNKLKIALRRPEKNQANIEEILNMTNSYDEVNDLISFEQNLSPSNIISLQPIPRPAIEPELVQQKIWRRTSIDFASFHTEIRLKPRNSPNLAQFNDDSEPIMPYVAIKPQEISPPFQNDTDYYGANDSLPSSSFDSFERSYDESPYGRPSLMPFEHSGDAEPTSPEHHFGRALPQYLPPATSPSLSPRHPDEHSPEPVVQEEAIDYEKLIQKSQYRQLVHEMSNNVMLIEITEYLSLVEEKPPGEVDVGVEFIYEYTEKLVQLVKVDQESFLELLNSPLPQDILNKLDFLQNAEIGALVQYPALEIILPADINLKLKETYLCQQYPCRRLYCQMLFDVINEALNYVRPYGITGEPPPWSKKPRKIYQDVNIKSIFTKVQKKLRDWAEIKGGYLPTDDIILPNGQPDENKLQTIREERLSKMLCSDVCAEEKRWIDYEDEEAQVQLDAADMLLEQIVEETAILLNDIDRA